MQNGDGDQVVPAVGRPAGALRPRPRGAVPGGDRRGARGHGRRVRVAWSTSAAGPARSRSGWPPRCPERGWSASTPIRCCSGLGSANAGSRVRLVEADLANPGWPAATELPGPWDAAVSSTALHWLSSTHWPSCTGRSPANLRPGGVFVNADNMGPALAQPRRDRRARSARTHPPRRHPGERGVGGLVAGPAGRRGTGAPGHRPLQRAIAHSNENGLSIVEQAELLRDAGFAEAGPVWQFGDDHVLVAVR